MEMDEVNEKDIVSDEENDQSLNGIKNDNIDDSTVSNKNDVLKRNSSADNE